MEKNKKNLRDVVVRQHELLLEQEELLKEVELAKKELENLGFQGLYPVIFAGAARFQEDRFPQVTFSWKIGEDSFGIYPRICVKKLTDKIEIVESEIELIPHRAFCKALEELGFKTLVYYDESYQVIDCYKNLGSFYLVFEIERPVDC